MPKSWVKQRKEDGYYKKAKEIGYRSRAAFKLIQINEKFSVMKNGDLVVDLGAAPGSWSQVASEIVGKEGRVIAVDRKRMKPLDNVALVRADLTHPEAFESIREASEGDVDVVISDMAPRLSGNRHIDQAKSISLAEIAFDFSLEILRKGGNFVAKVFQGDQFHDYQKAVASRFDFCKSHSPKASTSSSREIFVIAKGFRG
ncbi:MAG: RlmE family RNA methyltransferase [Methanobacteriota archaeon]|nr:MAG: RlmE family RNA methyltransferase [Euryarchaeota archaeon]